jgi:hypothetical protein
LPINVFAEFWEILKEIIWLIIYKRIWVSNWNKLRLLQQVLKGEDDKILLVNLEEALI